MQQREWHQQRLGLENSVQDSLKDSKGNPGSQSFIQQLDPRLRVVAAICFSITVVSLHNLFVLGLALAFAILVMFFARMPAKPTLKRMIAMDGFIIFMLIMLPFTMPGEAFFHLAGYPASKEGLFKAIEIALKANAAVLFLLAVVGSLETVVFGHALHRLYIPENLVHLLLFTVRYIEVLNQEYQRLRIAMKARGFRATTTVHCYRSFGYLIGMMLVRALERSERILKAMKCRGYSGKIPLLDNFAFTLRDYLSGLFLFILLSLFIMMEYVHVLPY